MISVELVCRGSLRESYLRDACDEYKKRLGAYCRLTVYEAKDENALIERLSSRAYKFALCVEGTELSSEELAAKLDLLQINGNSSFVFVIGAAEGLSEGAKEHCDFRLSFSKMTFPHQLMRVLLYEQLYRALNINAGGNYHK